MAFDSDISVLQFLALEFYKSEVPFPIPVDVPKAAIIVANFVASLSLSILSVSFRSFQD